jgi:hypothetical protein
MKNGGAYASVGWYNHHQHTLRTDYRCDNRLAVRQTTTGGRVVMTTDAEESAYTFSFAINDDQAAYLTQQLIAFKQPHASPLLLHLAEKEAGRRLFRQWANDRAGHPSAVEVGGCSAGFPQLAADVDGLIQTITVGQSTWQLAPACATLERATVAMRANPTITHCGDPTCARCADAVAGGPAL